MLVSPGRMQLRCVYVCVFWGSGVVLETCGCASRERARAQFQKDLEIFLMFSSMDSESMLVRREGGWDVEGMWGERGGGMGCGEDVGLSGTRTTQRL